MRLTREQHRVLKQIADEGARGIAAVCTHRLGVVSDLFVAELLEPISLHPLRVRVTDAGRKALAVPPMSLLAEAVARAPREVVEAAFRAGYHYAAATAQDADEAFNEWMELD